MRVRFRVDGVLSEVARVPKRMVAGVVSRIKIMSELDIAEKRVPQDGRVAVNVDDRRVDLRVVTVPTQRGEGATIRILDKSQALRSLDELGMAGEGRARFTEAYNQAYGAVLVTGPTGSGKSTTLYSALSEIDSTAKNIITIEDPVEYQMPGVNQMGVNRKAGLDFAVGLRSILRADPDVIMVGEVRDPETARIAIEAALTGHMVLTTLHTNDAPERDHPPAEDGDRVLPHRLRRRLRGRPAARPHALPRLQAPHRALDEASLEAAGFRVGADVEAWEPVGCGRCNGTGYRGRVGIYSVMTMSEGLKDLTVSNAPQAEITQLARSEGMLTLREDGLAKVESRHHQHRRGRPGRGLAG